MHGTENDFVIFDFRHSSWVTLDVQKIAHRKTGIGCDQVVGVINSDLADCGIIIYNADGSQAEICGNALRCVAAILMDELGNSDVTIEATGRVFRCDKVEDKKIRVAMGMPRLLWHEIPLTVACDAQNVPLTLESLLQPVCVNIGNPHAVFFVSSLQNVDVQRLGPKLESHPIFANRANIGFAEVISNQQINLRVWERGSGETRSCGSGACAATVASVCRGYVRSRVTVKLAGGDLIVEWKQGQQILMTGSVASVFIGQYSL